MADPTTGPAPSEWETPRTEATIRIQKRTDRAGAHGAAVSARRAASRKLDDAAHGVRRVADQAAYKYHVLERARPLGENAAAGLETAAQYVRTHEPAKMRDDLETRIRRRPLTAMAIAFVAGYMVRRIF